MIQQPQPIELISNQKMMIPGMNQWAWLWWYRQNDDMYRYCKDDLTLTLPTKSCMYLMLYLKHTRFDAESQRQYLIWTELQSAITFQRRITFAKYQVAESYPFANLQSLRKEENMIGAFIAKMKIRSAFETLSLVAGLLCEQCRRLWRNDKELRWTSRA